MQVWVGVDIGKVAHHVVALDGGGRQLLSRRVVNDEGDINAVVAEVMALGTPVCWAIDVTTGIAALLLARGRVAPGSCRSRYRAEGRSGSP